MVAAAPVTHQRGPIMSLSALISAGESIHKIADYLDQLPADARLNETMALGRAEQSKLWTLAAQAAPLTLDHFVPASTADRTEVIHHGRNTLPSSPASRSASLAPSTAASASSASTKVRRAPSSDPAASSPSPPREMRPGQSVAPSSSTTSRSPMAPSPTLGPRWSPTPAACSISSTVTPATSCAGSPAMSPLATPGRTSLR